MDNYYPDDAELTYRRKDTALVQGHFAKLGREVCAKPDGTPKRWLKLHGVRCTLASVHRNGNKFRPLEE